MEQSNLTQIDESMPKNTKGNTLFLTIALLFFFSPFLLVECGDSRYRDYHKGKYDLKITGTEFVFGSIGNKMDERSEKKQDPKSMPTNTWALISFICILVTIPTSVIYSRNASLFCFWACFIGFCSMLYFPISLFIEWGKEINMNFVHIQYGYVIVTLSLFVATICSSIKESNFKRYEKQLQTILPSASQKMLTSQSIPIDKPVSLPSSVSDPKEKQETFPNEELEARYGPAQPVNSNTEVSLQGAKEDKFIPHSPKPRMYSFSANNPIHSTITQPISQNKVREKEKTFVKEKTLDRKKPNYSISNLIGVVVLTLSLTIGGFFAYQQWYKPYVRDKNSPRYYTYNNTNLRSSKLTDTDANLITMLPYGTALIVYEQDNDWSYVKYNQTKGYMATPFLLSSEDYHLLNSIWGDQKSRDCVDVARCRRALLQYYKENNLYGIIDETTNREYTAVTQNWQVFTKDKEAKPNTVFYTRIFNRHSKYQDFAVVIKHALTGNKRLLIFTFDDDTEAPILIYEEDIYGEKELIKNITSSTGYYSKGNIKVQYEF